MKIQAAFVLLASLAAQPAFSATFDDETDFVAAVPDVVANDFENSTFDLQNTIDFGPGTASCSGDDFLCGSYFSNESKFANGTLSGVKSIFYSPTATLTFIFDSAITAFGIFIGGAGDVGAQTLTASLSNGGIFNALLNYENGSGLFPGNTVFFGVTSDTAFTSVTFSGNVYGDGIFFDDMLTSAPINSPAPVPLPASAPLLALGLATLARRRI